MSRTPIESIQPRWEPTHDPELLQIPGLDTSASFHEQIDQVEQLITIKLQNIDENFSKIQYILQNTLLPSVKRYSVATEPVREAARFWTSFYEEAAQIRISTAEDFSTVDEQHSGQRDVQATPVAGSYTDENPNLQHTPIPAEFPSQQGVNVSQFTDSSFGHGALTSTPATTRFNSAAQSMATDSETPSSFASSIESPLDRLGRNFRNFALEEDASILKSSALDETIRSQPLDKTVTSSAKPSARRKAKEETPLKSVLRRTVYTPKDVDTSGALALSPAKGSGARGVIPKEYNPYLPPNSNPKEWSGIVNLGKHNIASPVRHKGKGRAPPSPEMEDDDDSWDGLPPGMSPPRFMSPARPPRSTAELGLTTLGRTPAKDVAGRILQNPALGFENQNHSRASMKNTFLRAIEPSSSTLPTPPSMSRYHDTETTGSSVAFDSTIESMMRRVENMVASNTGSTSSEYQFDTHNIANMQQPPTLPEEVPSSGYFNPVTPGQDQFDNYDYLDDDDSELFDNEEFNTAHPSAAFIMASQRKPGINDDSLSSSEDSLEAEQNDLSPGEVHPHPFARLTHPSNEDDGWDDSFDEDDREPLPEPSETLFGIKEGQQVPQEALRLFGQPLNQDTADLTGLGSIASPTPAAGTASQRHLQHLTK